MIEIFDGQTDRYIYAVLIFTFFQFFRVLLRKGAYALVKKTSNKYDDDILDAIKTPIDFLFIIIGANFAKSVLLLGSEISVVLDHLIRSGFIIVIFWGLINILNHLTIHIHKITNKFGDKISGDVANFVIKSIRFFIIIIGFIAVLQEWGYNVSGFLASLWTCGGSDGTFFHG